ncbi:MAG: alkaline phosphatase family protein [Betaproteobacteria bacterium]|nr:alkaline phosphatase family protein [Betaproteobacteria bacterium]
MTSPRNVLFITIDQWRADALGCAGNTRLSTPHLDSLARDGVRFGKHYANAAPCGPSRAVMLTGMYQHNNGAVRNGSPLDPRFTNLALESRKAGYDPALFGYSDTAADPRTHHPNDPALKTFETVMRGFSPELHLPELPFPWLAHLRRQGYEFPLDMDEVYRPAIPTTGQTEDRGPTYAPTRFAAEHTITAFLTDELLDFISVRRDRPWFAHAAHIRPHPPFIAPEPYNALYRAEDMPEPHRAATPELEGALHPLVKHCLGVQPLGNFFVTGKGLVKDLSDGDLAQLRATYYGMITEVDDQIGRLLGKLREWGLYDSTLIVVTSDHGEMLGDHWMLGKEGFFDEAFHVPLIVREPSVDAGAGRGRICTEFTEAVDLMPTMLDWIGVSKPRQCDGRSLLDICHGRTVPDWRREGHWEFDFRNTWTDSAEDALGLPMDACSLAVIRDDRYKYVHFAALPHLFFDLTDDPHCLRDRSKDPALSATMLEYAQRMLSWRMLSNARELTGIIVGPNGVIDRR